MKTPFDHPSGDRGARTPLATLPGPASRRHRWLMQSLILLTLAVLAAMIALPVQAGGPPGEPRGGEARGVVSGQILVQPRAGLSVGGRLICDTGKYRVEKKLRLKIMGLKVVEW